MSDPLDGFVVIYRGQPIAFTKIDQGYYYQCPAGCCRAYHWIDTVTGDRHRMTSGPDEPISITASLQCPCVKDGMKCSWHVMIADGVAKDC